MRLEDVDRLGDVVLLRPPDIFQNGLGSLRNPSLSSRIRLMAPKYWPESPAGLRMFHLKGGRKCG